MSKVDRKKYSEFFLYCHFCGGFLARDENGALRCDSCLKTIYLNPIPSNAAIIQNKTGDILLVKRKDNPKKGYWDLPGGFVNLNESMEQSLAREIHEELGIYITNISYITSYPDVYHFQNIDNPTLGFIFSARISGNEKLHPGDDITEAKFFAPEKIPFEKIAFEGIRKTLEAMGKN